MFNFFKSRSSSGSSKSGKSPSSKMKSVEVQVPKPQEKPTAADDDDVTIELPGDMTKVALEDFDLLKVLGKGGFGKVMLVRYKRNPKEVYAMKVLKKEAVIRRNQVAHTKTETHILKQIRHPFLTRMFFGAPLPASPPRPSALL